MTRSQRRFLLVLCFLAWTVACLSAGVLVGAGVDVTYHHVKFGWPTALAPRSAR